METYLVGGAVRDKILGNKPKDLDYTVVLNEQDRWINDSAFYNNPFACMVLHLERNGYKIFLETPQFLTARAQTPDRKETADFVLARKESGYADGRRPDFVEPGTLTDDLARRDFTMNAIAQDSDGNFIDPFGGIEDIKNKTIRAVGSAKERLREDALRAVRAIRFSVTLGFTIEPELRYALEYKFVTDAIADNISDERICVELSKMFRYDSVASMRTLNRFPALTAAMFSGSVSLDSTMKTKGRGK